MHAPELLVVDDDDFVASAICDLLRYLGYRVARARNATEGWELFERQHHRAVITDNVMQGDPLTDMSGFDLAVRIKRASPATPVIMLSAIPPQGALAVCDTVLGKPVPMRDLNTALQRLNVLPEADWA